MSILSIDKTDFKGKIELSTSTTNVKLDNSIDQYEYDFLNKLLGPTLYEAFKTGLAETTPADKWTNLRDGKIYSIGSDDFNIRFVGVKEMCLYFIFAEHILNDLENTPNGSMELMSQNSTNPNRARIESESIKKYNIACNYYNEAIKFIRENITDYSDFVPTFINYR